MSFRNYAYETACAEMKLENRSELPALTVTFVYEIFKIRKIWIRNKFVTEKKEDWKWFIFVKTFQTKVTENK